MLYVATTFWLMVIVLTAWGVHHLWSGLVKQRTVNSILLPGTLVAQLGHVLGLLITGATVTNTTLYKDDESGEPQTTQDAKPRIPVLGPILIGMLPFVACAVGIFVLSRSLGGALFQRMTELTVSSDLPISLAGMWELARQQIDVLENLLDACLHSNIRNWNVWLFLYLLICLSVRMAPFPGNARGALGAILMLGLLLAIAGTLIPSTDDAISHAWPVLSVATATLMLLLLFSLLITGIVRLFRLLAGNR